MRSCLFAGAIGAVFLLQSTFSIAQGDYLGVQRASKGGTRPSEARAPELPSLPPGMPNSGGMTVSRDTKLGAGDEITFKVMEDPDPLLHTLVTDTGEVELNGLGRVYVAGKTTTEAQAVIEAYLKQRYYHRATVEVGISRKALGTVQPYKVVVAGKVGRPGPQYFTAANPLKLSEAVIVGVTSMYSELRKVRLTRGGKVTDHNVETIMKEGRTDLDVVLQDGDQVFVPARGIVFSGQ